MANKDSSSANCTINGFLYHTECPDILSIYGLTRAQAREEVRKRNQKNEKIHWLTNNLAVIRAKTYHDITEKPKRENELCSLAQIEQHKKSTYRGSISAQRWWYEKQAVPLVIVHNVDQQQKIEFGSHGGEFLGEVGSSNRPK